MTSQAETAKRIFGPRADDYDDSWHPAHAAEIARLAACLPGQHALDLGCGTGVASLPLARRVGAAGSVTAVDVTPGMLRRAEEKLAGARSLPGGGDMAPVRFLEGDVMDLGALREAGLLRDGGYDRIVGASCLPVLEDAKAALKHWATFLAPGGILIADFPTERSQVGGLIFEKVCRDCGLGVPFPRLWLKSKRGLEEAFEAAGLVDVKAVEIEGFGSVNDFSKEDIEVVLDRWVTYTQMEYDATMDMIREPFLREIDRRADSEGMVRDVDGFYVGIGKRK